MVENQHDPTRPVRTRILHCKDCGGYYDLKQDESLEDYGKCYCGGELEYTTRKTVMKRNLRHSYNFICPDCGNRINKKAENCPTCGRPITNKDLPPFEYSKLTSSDFKKYIAPFVIILFFSISLAVSYLIGNFYYFIGMMVVSILVLTLVYLSNRNRYFYYFIWVMVITLGIILLASRQF